MNNRRPLLVTIVLWLSATVFTNYIHADEAADSIRMQMKHLTGEQLLQAHMNLCFLAATGNDIDNELAAQREFIVEANRQNDVESEGLARSMLIMCYYNYHMGDSLKAMLPHSLAFMHKHGLWNHYYDSWNSLVELYLYEDNLQSALLEADKMYAHAKGINNNYGIGVSSYCLGAIYQSMQRLSEAKQLLQESIVALVKEEDIGLLLSAYNALGETLDELNQYNELRSVAVAWRAELDSYKQKIESKGFTHVLNGRYLSCVLAATVAEIETEQYKQAAELLSEAEDLAKGDNLSARHRFFQVQTRYYAATKQYDKAIASNSDNIDLLVSAGDSVSLLTMRLQQAKLLLTAGKHEEAIELYKQTVPSKDKLTNYELVEQLDALRTVYKLDRLTLKNRIVTYRFYFLLVTSSLLLVVVFLSIIYARRLRQKNRLLFNTYVKAFRKENRHAAIKGKSEQENLSNEDVLYNELDQLMMSEHLYKDKKLKRDDVASKLNTNHTYLADAVKKCGDGMTFSEFINRYRLCYSATLLNTNPDLNINEVGEESGFNSRSTYNRLFRDHYGMSPSEFRDIAKEKMLKSKR